MTLEEVKNLTLLYIIMYMNRTTQRFSYDLEMKRANKRETTNERKYSNLIGLSNGYKRTWLLVG